MSAVRRPVILATCGLAMIAAAAALWWAGRAEPQPHGDRVLILLLDGDAALRAGDPALAEYKARAALKRATTPAEKADAHALLAAVDLARGFQADALRHYDEAVRLNPDNFLTRTRRDRLADELRR